MVDKGRICAVVDTNVLVSSLLSSNGNSSPAIVLRAIFHGDVILLYNDSILEEYREVLSRSKFPFSSLQIDTILSFFQDFGVNMQRVQSPDWVWPDTDDIVFYEISLSVDGAFLVTGNTKHFPCTAQVVTPAQFVDILSERGLLRMAR